MIKGHIGSVTAKFEKAISKAQQAELEQRLETVSDDKYDAAVSVKTKSINITTILSVFLGLFGAGSFYLGLFKRGICKIVFNVVLPLTLGLVFLYWFAPLHEEYEHQSQEIYIAVYQSEEYDYNFDDLIFLQTSYSDTYDSLSTVAQVINDQTKDLIAIKNNLSAKDMDEKLEKYELIYSEYLDQLTAFTHSTSVSIILSEVNKSLENLKELSTAEYNADKFNDKEEYKDFYDLPDEFENIFNAEDFLKDKVSIIAFAASAKGLLENFIPKFNNLFNAYNTKTFESINGALLDLNPELKEADKTYGALYANIETVSKSKFSDLIGKIKELNTAVFNIKEENEKNTVEKADDTDLGVAISDFSAEYIEFFNKEIDKITINSFTDQILSESSKVKFCLDSVNQFAYYSSELNLIRDEYIDRNESYFQYLGTDYINKLNDTNAKLPEAKKNAVDKKVLISQSLTEICQSIKNIKTEDNIDSIQTNIDNVSNEITGLQERANDAFWNYRFDYKFVNLYFLIMLIADGVIIFVYWIFEIFRNREKCQNLNYENIIKAIE